MTRKAEPEPEIPESDDLPDDEPSVGDEPHGHQHTAGYPEHTHPNDHQVEYDQRSVNESGGVAVFGPERHDSDTSMAVSLAEEHTARDSLEGLGKLIRDAAEAHGWGASEVTSYITEKPHAFLELHGGYGTVYLNLSYRTA